MTTLRDKALPLFAKARSQLIDQKAGLRRYRVFVRRRVPSDGRGGLDATETVSDTELVEKPRVRFNNERDELQAGGRVESGTAILDRITPPTSAGVGGTALASIDLDPSQPGERVFIVLVGDDTPAYVPGPPPSGGAEFVVVKTTADKNFGYSVTIAPVTGRRE